jgi:asparagine synthase (glutamine-hydrolysing)
LGFFHGLLFDRETLVDSGDRDDPECSDADLILRAYERGGEGALSRLRGSFVVAIIDRTRGKAILARDPLGSHPLFYVEAKSRILFAASPRVLVNQPGISRSLNRAALADHLCHRWPDPGETFFTSVRRVPPGRRAIVSRGRLYLERYWDPMPQEQQWLTHHETARFDEVFDRAVDRCLRNGPTGIFLSGGLDSISVAAVATDCARRMGHKLPWALSLGFPDPACDERLRQAAAAQNLGLPQHLVDFHKAVGSPPLFEQSLGLTRELAAPILNVWLPAYLELARRAKSEGVRTILTGEGGDEWLTVTPFLSADLIRRGRFLELAQFYGVLRRSYQYPFALARDLVFGYGLRPLAGLALHRLMPEVHNASRLNRLLAGDPSWMITPDRDLRAEQRRRAERALTPSDPPQGFYLREVRQWNDHALASWTAEERYEVGKRIGVCFLQPFLDPDVVDMLCRIPPRLLNDGGRSKGLVRATLARRFPGLGLDRQRKVNSTSFYHSLIQREAQMLAETAGDFPALSELGIVDGRAARAAIGARLNGDRRVLDKLWAIVNTEVWVKSHGGEQHG